MKKGDETKTAILNAALGLVSTDGIEGLSIGRLAQMTGLSKSGLFAHFGSREALQRAVLELGRDRVANEVIGPVLKEPRGLPRVRALFQHYRDWINGSHGLPGGCPLLLAAMELADRDGPLQDFHADTLRMLIGFVEGAVERAVAEGHLAPDTDTRQFSVEFHGILLTFYLQRRLLAREDAVQRTETAFEALIRRYLPKGN